MNKDKPLELMDVRDVANYFNVTTLTIFNWIKKGYIIKPIHISPRKMVWEKNIFLKWVNKKFSCPITKNEE